MADLFGIRRSDGCWYNGTADHQAVFSPRLCDSGIFDSEEEAAIRGQGLVKQYTQHTFEVRPIGGRDAR